jgi:hypothetical protein
MLRYLQQLSGFFFYALGISFLIAYLLLRNALWPDFSSIWLQVADLPFALCAILYGGLSLYLSLAIPGRSGRMIGWLIAVPLAIVFLILVILNFWGAWPFGV